jgi:hypothetical protein
MSSVQLMYDFATVISDVGSGRCSTLRRVEVGIVDECFPPYRERQNN